MVFLVFAVSLVTLALLAASVQAVPDRPSRVVIIVLDQARPDTITRYGMENVQDLQRDGESFPNAYVGHMAAETVISHNVITSGQFPKHMAGRTRSTATRTACSARPGTTTSPRA